MICQNCGKTIVHEKANFCEYCGYQLNKSSSDSYLDQNMIQNPKDTDSNNSEIQQKEEPISFKNWLGSMCLPFIPVIGYPIYLVMLFIWSFSNETNLAKRNWARATLIITAISFIIFFFFALSITSSLLTGTTTLNELFGL